jgi:CheY-like chemotaxis protein
LKCFCAAPKSYKEKFWDSAPQELWSRLVVEHDRNAAEEPNPAPEETRRPIVLIVEPDKQIRRMAKRLVEGFGYTPVVAQDGMAGLAMALQYVPDLVLTAALMPRMDGREMCRRIKKSATTAKTKVAVMTELYTQKKYKAEAFNKFNVDEYASKPVAMRTLQSILQKYLD